MSNKIVKPLSIAIGTAMLGTLSLAQLASASTAFTVKSLSAGYMLALAGDDHAKGAEGKCGEGKCGMAKMDANKDSKVSQDEFMAAHKGMEGKCGEGKCGADKFKGMDSNADGMITQDEFDAAHKAKEGSCGGDKKAKEGSCGGHTQ